MLVDELKIYVLSNIKEKKEKSVIYLFNVIWLVSLKGWLH